MIFIELLEVYKNALAYADRMTSKNCLSFYKKTKEYWDGYKYASYKMFCSMKYECSDYNPSIQHMDNDTTYTNEDGCEFKACGILSYRDEIIDVFSDDCGQQMFIVYQGQIISGGSFNLAPEYDFCDEIDRIKDNIKF